MFTTVLPLELETKLLRVYYNYTDASSAQAVVGRETGFCSKRQFMMNFEIR